MIQQKAGQHEAGLLLMKNFASIAYLPATRWSADRNDCAASGACA